MKSQPGAVKAKQQTKVDGIHNVIIQAAGDGIHVNVGLPHVKPIPSRAPVPQTNTEIDLLNPYRRTFALVGRLAVMGSLWDRLHSARPVAIRTLTGRTRAGKTRIAIELIEQLKEKKSGQGRPASCKDANCAALPRSRIWPPGVGCSPP